VLKTSIILTPTAIQTSPRKQNFNLFYQSRIYHNSILIIFTQNIFRAFLINDFLLESETPESRSDFSRDLENLSLNLSPTRRETLNFPPSRVGKGARGLGFSSAFPDDVKSQINSPLTQVIAPLPSCRLPGANSPVLIIEDSVPAAEQITRYLNEIDIQSIIYSQGEGVIDEVLRVQPVIIFLDIQLPNLSGWDLLDQLKANPKTRNIPVIIISVLDERTQGIVNGASEYLVKPFTRAQFQATVEKVQNAAYAGIAPGMQAPLILLVEDNQANIDTMSGYLESRGYRLVLAQNGQQAIDVAKSQLPDLIVMDIQMPVMDGLEAMRRIREVPQFLHLPIIALTALAMSGDRELCLAAGANEYLTKPVKLKQLAIAIQRLLANSKK
jgi:CheY-like chemotaxis protein